MASLTKERPAQRGIGDIVLTGRVPRAKIIFFNNLPATYPLKGEGEYLVIGGEHRVNADYN